MLDNKKAITVSFVATALLIGFVFHLLFLFLAQSVAVFARIEANELTSNGLPVFLGALTFAILQFNKTTVAFTDGVVSELRKVVWPTGKDTGMMTIVVVIFVLVSALFLGAYDTLWAFLINKIVK